MFKCCALIGIIMNWIILNQDVNCNTRVMSVSPSTVLSAIHFSVSLLVVLMSPRVNPGDTTGSANFQTRPTESSNASSPYTNNLHLNLRLCQHINLNLFNDLLSCTKKGFNTVTTSEIITQQTKFIVVT